MIIQGEALEMEADQITRQNVGHRLRIFFFNEILSPSCTQPAQHYGRCVSDRQVHVQASGSNVHAPSLAPVVV